MALVVNCFTGIVVVDMYLCGDRLVHVKLDFLSSCCSNWNSGDPYGVELCKGDVARY